MQHSLESPVSTRHLSAAEGFTPQREDSDPTGQSLNGIQMQMQNLFSPRGEREVLPDFEQTENHGQQLVSFNQQPRFLQANTGIPHPYVGARNLCHGLLPGNRQFISVPGKFPYCKINKSSLKFQDYYETLNTLIYFTFSGQNGATWLHVPEQYPVNMGFTGKCYWSKMKS